MNNRNQHNGNNPQRKTSVLARPEPWDLVSSGYAEVTQPMVAQYSSQALRLVDLKESDYVLDVACGPGTLALLASPQVAKIQAIDFSINMVNLLAQNIQDQNIDNIEYHQASGEDLPFANEEFDLAASMFGLMFFADRVQGLRELHRTLKPGGTAMVSSWLPRHENTLFKLLMTTMMHVNPQMEEPPKISNLFEVPSNITAEFNEAGFNEVEIHQLTITTMVEDADVFWNQMVIGNAPIALMKLAMPTRDWKKLSKKAIAFLKKNLTLGEYELHAWLAVAKK